MYFICAYFALFLWFRLFIHSNYFIICFSCYHLYGEIKLCIIISIRTKYTNSDTRILKKKTTTKSAEKELSAAVVEIQASVVTVLKGLTNYRRVSPPGGGGTSTGGSIRRWALCVQGSDRRCRRRWHRRPDRPRGSDDDHHEAPRSLPASSSHDRRRCRLDGTLDVHRRRISTVNHQEKYKQEN